MKTTQLFAMRLVALVTATWIHVLCAAPMPPSNGTPSTIGYNPNAKIVQGTVSPFETYQLAVTGPSAASPTNPVTIDLGFEVLKKPDGFDVQQALRFISANTTRLTFDAPAEVLVVHITVAVPVGTQAGDFQWKIKAPAWPAAANVGTDAGATVNATVVVNPSPVSAAPVAVLQSPAHGQVFVFDGITPVRVPIQFSGTVGAGGTPITSMEATFEGTPLTVSASGIGQSSATGTALSHGITVPGTYTVCVAARNANEVGFASAEIVVATTAPAPKPAIRIDDPDDQAVFNHLAGTPALNIPFQFTVDTNPGFTVDSVSAQLDGAPVVITSTAGLGKMAAVAAGSLAGVCPGVHTFTARGVSGGATVSASTTFTVREVVPPTVTILTPLPDSVFPLLCDDVNVPLLFTAMSHQTGGTITELTATLDGVPVTVVPLGLGKAVATGMAMLSVSSAGDHTIGVTAKDAFGTAVASRTFRVTSNQPLTGAVFFDVDASGARTPGEPGVAGVAVTLRTQGGRLVATATTSAIGTYSFNVAPGAYAVTVSPFCGLKATTATEQSLVVGSGPCTAADVGLGLDWKTLRTMKADGCTIGFWKNNLQKALSNKHGGQISGSTLAGYTTLIAGPLALDPYAGMTEVQAIAIMSSASSEPAALLAKQLLASEYNYAAGAYLNGSKPLTLMFITWGEHVLHNSGRHSKSELLWAKDWFDAYNNSHGGFVSGPAF